jgi:uncharacterized protein
MKLTDPILRKYRAALDDLYGDRIERVVLFGSRARGDARPDSDYDVAVFLKDMPDVWAEMRRLVDLKIALRDSDDVDVQFIPFEAGSWAKRTLLMHGLRTDGLDI